MSKDNTCIFCNEVIPEGMMVCPVCEEALRNIPLEDIQRNLSLKD